MAEADPQPFKNRPATRARLNGNTGWRTRSETGVLRPLCGRRSEPGAGEDQV